MNKSKGQVFSHKARAPGNENLHRFCLSLVISKNNPKGLISQMEDFLAQFHFMAIQDVWQI
jgi:hypothetical protein